MDLLHKSYAVLDHHRYLLFGLLMVACGAGWLVGCQPTTTSLLDPSREVTAPELAGEAVVFQRELDKQAARIEQEVQVYNSEVAAANELLQVAHADIAQKLALRKKIVEVIGGLGVAAAEGSFSPVAAAGSIVQLLLAGLVVTGGVDIFRKNQVIKTLKNGAKPPGESTASPSPMAVAPSGVPVKP